MLLVDTAAEPPESLDVLEEWVRIPASDADLKARVRSLRARVQDLSPIVPTIADDGTLEFRSARLELTPLQARLVEPLIDRFGTVVGRDALQRSGWPNGDALGNTLDVHMVRLRRRLEAFGLQIRTVRSRGFLLTDADAA